MMNTLALLVMYLHLVLEKPADVEIINEGNEAGSFLRTLEIVESRGYDDDTIIYFVEDDYLHRENWCEVLIEPLVFQLNMYHYTIIWISILMLAMMT